METDEWDFSAEELESLEKDALNRIAQRNAATNYNHSPSSSSKVNSLPTASSQSLLHIILCLCFLILFGN